VNTNMTEDLKFNRLFFVEQENEFLEDYQASRGCFGCGKPDAKQKCGQCGVALYCGRQW